MLLDPLTSIILFLFVLFLLAALIIWFSIHYAELRFMGSRDKQYNLEMESAANNAEFDVVSQGEMETALNTGLEKNLTGEVASQPKQSAKAKRQAERQAKEQAKKQASMSKRQNTKTKSSKSSAFKTTSFGSASLESESDAFAQFAQKGQESGASRKDASKSSDSAIEHEANLLKPPKAEDDIFSTSERRDDIWLFHTAEVDPVHPAEDMTKFRQPGDVTSESNTSSGAKPKQDPISPKGSRQGATSSARESQVNSANSDSRAKTPVQPENKLRDRFDKSTDKHADAPTSEDGKVVRMTNNPGRIAAERLTVDKETTKTQAEVTQAASNSGIKEDISMPVTKAITPAKPSQPFQGTVPPVPEGIHQKLKHTLDEDIDNVSNTSKDDWSNYKNLKNTRSLISTKTDDD